MAVHSPITQRQAHQLIETYGRTYTLRRYRFATQAKMVLVQPETGSAVAELIRSNPTNTDQLIVSAISLRNLNLAQLLPDGLVPNRRDTMYVIDNAPEDGSPTECRVVLDSTEYRFGDELVYCVVTTSNPMYRITNKTARQVSLSNTDALNYVVPMGDDVIVKYPTGMDDYTVIAPDMAGEKGWLVDWGDAPPAWANYALEEVRDDSGGLGFNVRMTGNPGNDTNTPLRLRMFNQQDHQFKDYRIRVIKGSP